MSVTGRLLATVSCLFIGALLVAGCGGKSNAPASTSANKAVQKAADPDPQGHLQAIEKKVKSQGVEGPGKKAAKGGAGIGNTGITNCGGGVSAGSYTSCPFAQEVRWAYESSEGARHYLPNGEVQVGAYSPVTGETYVMACTTSSPHVCTGGNNASVYFP
jgi:hypothetical protein